MSRKKDIKNIILFDLLGLSRMEASGYTKLVKKAVAIAKTDLKLPDFEREIVEDIQKIFDWHAGLKEQTNPSTGALENKPNFKCVYSNRLVLELNRISALSACLSERRAYWRHRTTAMIVNRRASKAAVSVGLRQFGGSLNQNIRKKLTVADCNNFSEILTGKQHADELYAVYVSEYLDEINRGCKMVIHGIDQLLAQERQEKKEIQKNYTP